MSILNTRQLLLFLFRQVIYNPDSYSKSKDLVLFDSTMYLLAYVHHYTKPGIRTIANTGIIPCINIGHTR